jgi:mitotic spindle assembly checkpoint protein MAD2
MAATAQATRNEITLKGSVATVTEFFRHALSSILYQRGIYGPESFEPAKAYGLTVMAVKDDKLAAYLQAVLKQFSGKSLLWVLHLLPLLQLPPCPLRIRRCI